MNSTAINAPHTRAAAASLDQKASGPIGAPTPSVPELEWTSLEHPRAHEERGSAASVREELTLWPSPRMQAVRDVIKQVAPIDVTALLTGETGTGKELVARAVHHLDSRHNGAFTGAHQLKIGKFEAANRIKDAALDRNRRATDRP